MAQVKYDLSDVEAGGGGESPQPGLYRGKIAAITHRKKNKAGETSDLEVVIDVGKDYSRLWYYAILPDAPHWDKKSHGWKLRELVDALGLPEKGGIDTSPAKLKKFVGQEVNVKVVADTDEDGGYKGKAKNLYAPTGDAKPAGGGESAAEGGDDEGPYGAEELGTWPQEDLVAYAEELGVDVPTGRGAKAKLIEALVEAEEEAAGDPAPDAEDANEGEGADDDIPDDVKAELSDDPDHYKGWDDSDLIWMVEGLGIDGNVKTSGRGWQAKAIAAIVDVAGSVGGGAEPDAEPDETDTYDDEETWSTEDLKQEVKDRNEQGAEIEIAGRATRAKLIEALRADDASAEPF